MDGLWPFAEGTFITQLLSTRSSTVIAVPEVAGLYHLLLEGLPVSTEPREHTSPVVNALAFGCNVQQSLWRQDIPTLRDSSLKAFILIVEAAWRFSFRAVVMYPCLQQYNCCTS